MAKKPEDKNNNEENLDTSDFSTDGSEISIEDNDNVTPIEEGKSAASETEKLKAEAEKYKNEYLYLMADFENYKKQAIKERSQLIKFGSERLVVSLLEVLDNLERALQTEVTPDNLDSFVDGVKMTRTELSKVLKNFGVEEVPSEGVAFDPNVHEALSSQQTEDVPEGHIVSAYKKAYKLHDRVVRPAQVIVATPPKES
ncbi:MAG: nucleotide exchange factor GrpE [Bdellovibrionales bacterium]|nr:nucleotide exchange factor GrpE [Bdellovibrionales bacterium]